MNFWDGVLNGTRVLVFLAPDSAQIKMVEDGSFGAVVDGRYYLFFPEAGVLPVPGFRVGHEREYWCVGVARGENSVMLALCKRNVRRGKEGGGYGVVLSN